jgi:hypothetical protein
MRAKRELPRRLNFPHVGLMSRCWQGSRRCRRSVWSRAGQALDFFVSTDGTYDGLHDTRPLPDGGQAPAELAEWMRPNGPTIGQTHRSPSMKYGAGALTHLVP